jgi:outer membrane protein TolC
MALLYLLLPLLLPATALAQAPVVESLRDSVVTVIPGAFEVLEIEDCIEAALAANDQLEAERARLQELRAQKVQARADGLPRLDLLGDFSRGRDPSFALDSTFGGGGDAGLGGVDTGDAAFDSLYLTATGQIFGEGFIPAPEAIPAQTFWRTYADLYWELHPTRVLYAVKAANIALDQQALNIEDLEHRTVEETMRLYYTVLAAHAQAGSVEAELEARREFLDITRRRFRLEMATPLDTLQARVQMANLLPGLRRARQEVVNAGRSLNAQMGRDPSAPLSLRGRLVVERTPVDPQRAVALALARPDIQRSELGEDYLHRERDTLKSEMHPYLTVTGSYGWVTRELDQLTDTGHDFWRTGVTLTVPIFDGLLTRGRVKEREASIRRTQHETSGLRRRAEEEALSALGDLEVARANLEAARLNMDQAEQALAQTNRRYELGKGSYLEVLNAQAARFTARSNLIEAYYEVLVGTATLKRSMGIRPTQPLSVVEETRP